MTLLLLCRDLEGRPEHHPLPSAEERREAAPASPRPQAPRGRNRRRRGGAEDGQDLGIWGAGEEGLWTSNMG